METSKECVFAWTSMTRRGDPRKRLILCQCHANGLDTIICPNDNDDNDDNDDEEDAGGLGRIA